MMWKLKNKMKGSNGLLILDEAQHLKMDAIEIIRSLHDSTEIGLALVGNQSINTLTKESNSTPGRRAQISSRIVKRTILSEPTKRDVNAMCAAFKIEDKDAINFAYGISKKAGALRLVKKTIRHAVLFTPEGQTISYDTLVAAYQNLNGTSTHPEET